MVKAGAAGSSVYPRETKASVMLVCSIWLEIEFTSIGSSGDGGPVRRGGGVRTRNLCNSANVAFGAGVVVTRTDGPQADTAIAMHVAMQSFFFMIPPPGLARHSGEKQYTRDH